MHYTNPNLLTYLLTFTNSRRIPTSFLHGRSCSRLYSTHLSAVPPVIFQSCILHGRQSSAAVRRRVAQTNWWQIGLRLAARRPRSRLHLVGPDPTISTSPRPDCAASLYPWSEAVPPIHVDDILQVSGKKTIRIRWWWWWWWLTRLTCARKLAVNQA